MNYLLLNKNSTEILHKLIIDQGFHKKELDHYYLIYDEEKELQSIYVNEESTNICIGYLSNENCQKSELLKKHINESSFPIPDDHFGSFSIVSLNKDELTLINDPIGVYPLYYCVDEFDGLPLYVTNNYVRFFDIIGSDIDSTFIVECLIGPEYSELADRTAFEILKRLLPGEGIFFKKGKELNKKYDNTLFSNISDNFKLENVISKLEGETLSALNFIKNSSPKIDFCLSAGLDSRLTLATIPKNIIPEVNAFTYGEPSSLEVSLAKKMSESFKLKSFRSFWDDRMIVPLEEVVKKYLVETNSLSVPNWLPILENYNCQSDIIFLGDMCESIPARNMGEKNSRNNRILRVLKSIFIEPTTFEKLDSEKADEFKSRILREYESKIVRLFELNPELLCLGNVNEIVLNVKSDINKLFERVFLHNLKFVENAVELYSWYTHARVPMGKQISIWNFQSTGVSPSMGISALRTVSNIEMQKRIDYKLMFQIFNTKRYRKFVSVGTAQNPFIPFRYTNRLFYLVLWGLRSKLDNYLIKHNMNRVYKTIDWKTLYQTNMDKFRFNGLYRSMGDKLAVDRASGKAWPLVPFDIVSMYNIEELLRLKKDVNK